eukprot:TRINITY_DN8879_c0_g1_i2.p1 TRINITY_DN8879_c0_g1~~TRINITY_DN8879_c0_g1_i2.p1  ORF type:complete len:298 (+),score=56.34 TRINITY_DN8879_c0_g1_i2:55-894(+)
MSGPGILLTCSADNDDAAQPKRFPLWCGEVSIFEELDPPGDDDDEAYSVYSNNIWDGAIFAAALFRRQPWLVRGRRVLEIGAGLGLPSIVAAALGADAVVTEQAPLRLLRREVGRNSGVVSAGGGRARVAELNWEWPVEKRTAALGSAAFDVVLGCDVLAGVKAGTDHFHQILGLVAALLEDGGDGLLTWIPRMGAPDDRLVSCAAKALPGWRAEFLDASLHDIDFPADGCRMLHLWRPCQSDGARDASGRLSAYGRHADEGCVQWARRRRQMDVTALD